MSPIRFPSSSKLYYTSKSKTQNVKALRVLDFITPNNKCTQQPQNHLRLIESCMQELQQPTHLDTTPCLSDKMYERNNVCWGTLFIQMHRQGMSADASTLSCALSSIRCLEKGVQLHCLAMKSGFYVYVYVGSSLTSFYGKCGHLNEAYRVFEEIPVKNVVSWTAIIAGFAQNWDVDMCLMLYYRMRCSASKPNDFTFTSLLSVCTGSGSLGQGRSAHCQTIQMGFESYIHIGNVLISMYSKCGNVDEAFCIFECMRKRDLVSWNSMIAGYAQYGLAEEAIELHNEMKELKINPDAITFLGVLSSCRHAGLVEYGRICFNSMVQYGVEPDLDHYSCIVDLLGRAGMVKEANEFINKMPICPNAVIWGSLLSSCRLHGEVLIGIEAAENRLLLVPSCAATHVQLVNLYANAGRWEQVARVRKLMKDRGLKTYPGCSWIEIKNEVYKFRAEDRSNARVDEILAVVDSLIDNMRRFGHVPEVHEEGLDQ